MLPLSAQKGGWKSEFFVFLSKSQRLIGSQALPTYLAGQCHKHLMVGRNVYRTTVDGVKICIRQLGRVEEIIWLPYDAGLSAA